MSSMNTHSLGASPSRSAACRKMRSSGLRMPTSAEMTTAWYMSASTSRGYASLPHEFDSRQVRSPAARASCTAVYIGSQGSDAANILVSSPSARTCPPSRRTSIGASRRSKSPMVHSPRSRAWIGLPSFAGSYAASSQGRMAAV